MAKLIKVIELLYRGYYKNKLRLSYYPNVRKPFEVVGVENIVIGRGFSAAPGVRIEAWSHRGNNEVYTPRISIGDNVLLQYRTHITAIGSITIGNGVLTGSDVLISDNNHGRNHTKSELSIPPRQRKLYSKGGIIIEDNVWIGDKVVILGGVKIGRGSVIGAGSVVTKDIPDYAIAVGNPAKVIKLVSS